jgi:hypothetical protein
MRITCTESHKPGGIVKTVAHPRIQQLVAASSTTGMTTAQAEARYEQSMAARDHFRSLELNTDEYILLIWSASRSNRLFLALAGGDWDAAVRALRGVALSTSNPDSFRQLIVKLTVQTPLGLEASGVRKVVEEEEPVLMAA